MNNSAEVGTTPPPTAVELSKLELSTRIDIYKAHFDLFIKGVALYLAIVGTIAGLTFQSTTSPATRSALALFVSVCSGLGVAASKIALLWIQETQLDLDKICTNLNITRISLTAASRIVTLVLILTLCLFVIGVGASYWFIVTK